MIITNTTIANLRPCDDRHQNYLNHYKNIDLSIDDFIDSANLTYNDKIWACRRLMTAVQARTFAILCAESVLPIFEAKYPDNLAPRNLLNCLKSIPDLGNLTDEQKSAIVPLRKDCYDAYSAAYSAADANAAYAAAAANAASYAATYAAYAAAAANAASYAAYAAARKQQQQELNLTYLKMAFSL